MTDVAYLRKDKQTVEIDYPLSEVWAAIPSAITSLEWTIEQLDDETHKARVKTKAGFMVYSSKLTITGIVVGDQRCRIMVENETPVTTITSLADFGRSANRTELFFETLAKALSKTENS